MASSQGLHSLATIIKRLEAATSRLEDIASSQPNPGPPSASSAANSPLTTTLHIPPPPPPPPPAAETTTTTVPVASLPQNVIEFDEKVVAAKITPWVELSKALNVPLINEIVTLITKGYDELRNFLILVGSCQKPDEQLFGELLSPVNKAIDAFNDTKASNRREREIFGHLQYASEAAIALGWIVHTNPPQFVKDTKESSDYYGDRVKKDFKEKDPRHVEWCRGLDGIFTAVRDYVQEFYKQGITWNDSGPTVQEFKAAAAAAAASPPAGGVPTGGVAAVFAELNRGAEVTKGLKKVDKSEMTHKNPSLRAGNSVAASPTSTKKPARPTKPPALAGKKPPKFVLEGMKWVIENQENEKITVRDTALNHSINIYNCSDTEVYIEGKVNAVNLVRSTRTSILLDSVVSAISVTSSPSFTVQVKYTVPMIQVDTTDSGQIYLSEEAAEITTAKCSAINIHVPKGEGKDFTEHPVPEMLRTVVEDGKLVTTIVEHRG